MENNRGYLGPVFLDNADLYLADHLKGHGFGLDGWSASIGDNAVILDGKRVKRQTVYSGKERE